ncbi:MAG: hypothetical protein U0Q12_25070 [Vicinamibacterales bacterium]
MPHPHRHTFRGEPASLAFPPLCPCCGQTAAAHVEYAKVFARSHGDSAATLVTTTVLVPFCADCARRHSAQSPPRRLWLDVLSTFSSNEMLGAVTGALGAVFFVYLGATRMLRDPIGAAIMFGVGALAGGYAWFMQRIAWRDLPHLRVSPQTEVTTSFDFSDDLAEVFESPRFACTVRDARFADGLAQLNADRLWVAASAEARDDRRRARLKLWVAVGAILLFALLAMLAD